MTKLSFLAALGLLFTASSAVLPGAAHAQQTAESPPPEEVTVTAERTREAIQAFTRSVTVAPRTTGRLARWDRTVCPGILGMHARQAQFVLDRIAYRALEVGLGVGQPNCVANALIIVTRDPDEAARMLRENYSWELGYYHTDAAVRAQGRDAFERFVTSDAPVRWWHVSRTMTRDGMPSQPPDLMNIMNNNQIVGGGSSRMGSTSRQDFGLVLLIVDARQLPAVHGDIGALADYLAMVTLAQLDPQSDTTAFSTILNLFSPAVASDRPTGLTEWDSAYLRGLYGATRDSTGFRQQEEEIADSMDRTLTH